MCIFITTNEHIVKPLPLVIIVGVVLGYRREELGHAHLVLHLGCSQLETRLFHITDQLYELVVQLNIRLQKKIHLEFSSSKKEEEQMRRLASL